MGSIDMLDAPLMLGTLAIDTNTINVIIANVLFLGCLIFKIFIKPHNLMVY